MLDSMLGPEFGSWEILLQRSSSWAHPDRAQIGFHASDATKRSLPPHTS
jgi:hypothetical protein